MEKKRLKIEKPGFQHTISEARASWSKLFTRRIVPSAVGVALSVALAACGGGSAPTSGAIPTTQGMAEVAAAASAASSTSVSLATSLKMNASSIATDTQTDRFIVKYKTGTPERGATSALQPRLDKLASAFPSRRHLRRMGIGSDVVTTERKLNAKEAKAFMRAVASDPPILTWSTLNRMSLYPLARLPMIRSIACNGGFSQTWTPVSPM
jgi:serine protease